MSDLGPDGMSEPVTAVDHVLFGLGNPGARYRDTRHNLGFLLIDKLEENLGLTASAGRGDYLISVGQIHGHKLHLVRPMTFMNLSGRAVSQVLEREKLDTPGILIAVDDVAIDLGRLRLRPSGSDGGHNGLRSVHEYFGGGDYARLRLGCGPALEDEDLADFVLGKFADDEWGEVNELLDRAMQAVKSWVADGVEMTMSRYNG